MAQHSKHVQCITAVADAAVPTAAQTASEPSNALLPCQALASSESASPSARFFAWHAAAGIVPAQYGHVHSCRSMAVLNLVLITVP